MNSAHVMLVDLSELRVALVAEGGSLSLPKLVGDGPDPVDLLAAVGDGALAGDAASGRAPWHTRLTPLIVLARLAQVVDEADGAKTTRELYLCEPGPARSLAALADGWWAATDADLPELPEPLNSALRSTLSILAHGEADGEPWPFFNLPGAGVAIADILTAVPAAAAVATMPDGSGIDRPTDLRQVRGWCLSSVWQNDEVVLKLTHPNWQGEPAVTDLLGRSQPEHVERLIAGGSFTAPGHRPTPWLLQRRIRGRSGGEEADPDRAASERLRLSLATVQALARLQLANRGREEELLAAGVADRHIAATRAALPRLWAAAELSALEPAERAALPLLEKSIHARLDALAELGTGPLLAHGDLHLGNVIEAESGELKLIDWTDAALSWPGVDLLTLLPRRSQPEHCGQIIAAYEAALGERLAQAVEPGLDLADIFHAISYANIDAFLPRSRRWELGGTVTFLVKRQLEQVLL